MTTLAVLAQWMHYGWNAWWMWIPMTVFWLAVIGIVVAVIRTAARRDDGGSRAEDLLAERYARGEIDTDEYQTRSRELEKARR